MTALYHVTFTSKVPAILRQGLRTFQTSNWVKAGDRSRFGSGEVFAFELELDAYRWAARMDWEHHKEMGSGKISIVKFKASPQQAWEVDHSDPLSQAAAKGAWLKSRRPIPAECIVVSVPFSLKMVRHLVQS